MSETSLKRRLSLTSMIALSAGGVLGGWLAEAPYWFELTGAGAAFIFPALAVLLLPAALAFSELTAMLPFSSSVDVWASNAMNTQTGWATQWLFFLVQVVEPPLVAFIFVTAASFFVDIPDGLNAPIAMAILVAWYVIANFNIKITGRLALILFFLMLPITLIDSSYFYTSGHWKLSNITDNGGLFPFGILGAIAGGSALVLKYIGFGMTPTLIQETTISTKQMVIVLCSALFIPAIVYAFATFALAGLAPHDAITDLKMPGPELVMSIGMPRIFAFLEIFAGVLFALTTLMAFWTSSARALYGASQLRQLPPWFTKTNSQGQPYVANTAVLAVGLFFCIFTGTNWVEYIYSLSVVAAGAVYFLVCLSAYILRNKHPEWERPYRAHGGKYSFVIGMIVSAAITIIGTTLLPPNAWFPVLAYAAIGILIPIGMKYYRKNINTDYMPVVLTPDDKAGVGTIE